MHLTAPLITWAMLPVRPQLGERLNGISIHLDSSCRNFYPSERAKSQEILTKLPMDLEANEYDAWEEDIALVKVYFAKDSAPEFKR